MERIYDIQKKRLANALQDDYMRVLEYNINDEQMNFVVLGSSVRSNNYNITIGKKQSCDCFDFKRNKGECFCKHMYLVYMKIFSYECDEFMNIKIDSEKLSELLGIFNKNIGIDRFSMKTDLEGMRSSPDDMCVICLDLLGSNKLHMCKNCLNGFHRDCISLVIKSTKKCPLCRFGIHF